MSNVVHVDFAARRDTTAPGSALAQRLGCSCPRIDNHHGEGRRGDSSRYGYIVDAGCTLHTKK